MITKTQWHTLKQKDNFKPSFAHNTDTDYAKTHHFFGGAKHTDDTNYL